MKRNRSSWIILGSVLSFWAAAGGWEGQAGNAEVRWIRQGGGAGSTAIALRTAADRAGNLVVAGAFSGSITIGDTKLMGAGTRDHTFLAKYDAQGGLQWAREVTASQQYVQSSGLAIDSAGSIYLSAVTYGATEKVLCAKFDSAGGLLWAKERADLSSFNAGGNMLALDGSGHIFLAARSTVKLTAVVMKLDPSGDEVWRQEIQANGGIYAQAIACDRKGNCAVTGWYGPNADQVVAGPVVLGNAGWTDAFAVKYDVEGNVIWGAAIGSEDLDYAQSIAMDDSGAVYVAGTFNMADSGATLLFVRKFDLTGAVAWTRQAAGEGWSEPQDMMIAPSGEVWVAGYLSRRSIRFDSVEFKYETGEGLSFLVGFNGEGDLTVGQEISSSGTVFALAGGDGAGNLYVGGRFAGTGRFGSTTLQSTGKADFVVASVVINRLAPRLMVQGAGDQMILAWPVTFPGFALESTSSLATTGDWAREGTVPATVGDQVVVTLDAGSGARFFRLRKR